MRGSSFLAAVIAFRGATLIDGTGGPPVPNSLLVVSGGRIASAGVATPEALKALPAGCELVAAEGRWILPGLIDAHVHAESEEDLKTMLAWGVTSVRLMAEDASAAGSLARASGASLAPAAGFAAFLAYCGRAFGDPLAPFHRQETWRGAMTWPPGVWREIAEGPLALMAPRRSAVELLAAVAFLALGILAFRNLPRGIALYGLAATLLPLATSLFSFSRLSLASFPVFITAGALLRGWPALARGLEAFFALLLGAFALLYFTWNWIG